MLALRLKASVTRARWVAWSRSNITGPKFNRDRLRDTEEPPLSLAFHFLGAWSCTAPLQCTIILTFTKTRVLPPKYIPGNSRCLDAFIVALSQACEGADRRWYASILELQLASLDFCRACRNIPRLAVTVGGRVCSTPESLWISRHASKPSLFRYPFRSTDRVPRVRALRLKWSLQLSVLVHHAAVELWACSDVVELAGGCFGAATLASVVWPRALKQLSFGDWFIQPIVGAVWPASLQQLSFGFRFNQPIIGADWPASLQQLSFGSLFNQAVVGVVWPATLQQLSFGLSSTRLSSELCGPTPFGS